MLEGERIWGMLFLLAFGILGVPSVFAHVTIDDSVVHQQFFARRSVTWAEIISWQRVGHEGSDGPDINHVNCDLARFIYLECHSHHLIMSLDMRREQFWLLPESFKIKPRNRDEATKLSTHEATPQ